MNAEPSPAERQLATAEDGTCRGFHWIGQTRRSCEKCGRPEWEHDGWAKPDRDAPFAFGTTNWILDPWTPEQAERMAQVKAAWEANAVYEEQSRYRTDWSGHSIETVVNVRYGRDFPQGEVVEEARRAN